MRSVAAVSAIFLTILIVIFLCQHAYRITPQESFSLGMILVAVVAVAKLIQVQHAWRENKVMLVAMTLVILPLTAWMIYQSVQSDRKEDETQER